MKFLINGTLEGQPFEMEIEGEDREDAIVELNHSVICLDGKPLTRFPKFDLRTIRKAPEQPAESEDAGIVWPKNEVRQVKGKLGETRIRPPFVISDDE